MARFEVNNEGVEKLLRGVGEQHAERYRRIDQELRTSHRGAAAQEVLAALRSRMQKDGLSPISNMEAWAAAIAAGKDFTITLRVG